MTSRTYAVLLAALLLTACGREGADKGAEPVDPGNPLEIAARERGIVREDLPPPTGVYERQHELGRDAMCVIPDGDDQWRFSLNAAFGPGLSCAASGQMVREGEGWRMRFAQDKDCNALVEDVDDELHLPGSLPEQCEKICPSKASLAGLRLPRASWAEGDARRLRLRDKQGNNVLPCSGG